MNDKMKYCTYCNALFDGAVGHPKLTKIARIASLKIYICDTCDSSWCFDPNSGWRALREGEVEMIAGR